MRYTAALPRNTLAYVVYAAMAACASPGAGGVGSVGLQVTPAGADAPATGSEQAIAPSMRVHFIDVGQGAATLLEFSCGAVLIDAGGERQPSDHRGAGCPHPDRAPPATYDGSARLLGYLRAFFARRTDLRGHLDALYLTHPHVDHTRGAPAVLRAFSVGVLVTNGQEEGSGACEQLEAERLVGERPDARSVRVANPAAPLGITNDALDPVACVDADPELRVLFGRVDAATAHADWSATDLRNENEHSLVVRLAFGSFGALFMGDLERQGIHDLLAQSDPEALDIDLLQVGHHGSNNATTVALLTALSPVSAVIPMGSPAREAAHSAWGYGHPRGHVVSLLVSHVSGRAPARTVRVATAPHVFEDLSLEAAVYGTGWDGDVVIEAFADGTHRRVGWSELLEQPAPPAL